MRRHKTIIKHLCFGNKNPSEMLLKIRLFLKVALEIHIVKIFMRIFVRIAPNAHKFFIIKIFTNKYFYINSLLCCFGKKMESHKINKNERAFLIRFKILRGMHTNSTHLHYLKVYCQIV